MTTVRIKYIITLEVDADVNNYNAPLTTAAECATAELNYYENGDSSLEDIVSYQYLPNAQVDLKVVAA